MLLYSFQFALARPLRHLAHVAVFVEFVDFWWFFILHRLSQRARISNPAVYSFLSSRHFIPRISAGDSEHGTGTVREHQRQNSQGGITPLTPLLSFAPPVGTKNCEANSTSKPGYCCAQVV